MIGSKLFLPFLFDDDPTSTERRNIRRPANESKNEWELLGTRDSFIVLRDMNSGFKSSIKIAVQIHKIKKFVLIMYLGDWEVIKMNTEVSILSQYQSNKIK